jgi:hypothetical protein
MRDPIGCCSGLGCLYDLDFFWGERNGNFFVKQGIFNSDVGEISLNVKGQTRNINRKGKKDQNISFVLRRRERKERQKKTSILRQIHSTCKTF